MKQVYGSRRRGAVLCLLSHGLRPRPANCRPGLSPGRWQGRARDTFIYYRGKNKPNTAFPGSVEAAAEEFKTPSFEQQCKLLPLVRLHELTPRPPCRQPWEEEALAAGPLAGANVPEPPGSPRSEGQATEGSQLRSALRGARTLGGRVSVCSFGRFLTVTTSNSRSILLPLPAGRRRDVRDTPRLAPLRVPSRSWNSVSSALFLSLSAF